jgi:hypothetical protein
LLDFEARGWVRHLGFAGDSGWFLTDAGRAENERRLAAELGRAGVRDTAARAHATFAPLNRRFGTAWVDGPDRDSCHIRWIQFREDLLATLGIPRGSDS